MRLLFLSTVYPTPFEPTKGMFNRSLVRALAARHEVRVVAPVPWPVAWGLARPGSPAADDRSFEEREIEAAFPTYYYTPKLLRPLYGTFLWLSLRHALFELFASFRPHAVLGYWAHPDGEAAVRAAQLADAVCGLIVGGSDLLLLARDRRRKRAIQRVLASVDAIFPVGGNLAALVEQLGASASRVHSFHRGVDTTLFAPGAASEARSRLGLDPRTKVLLWVGRMVHVKGLEVLIAAVERVRAQEIDCVLVLVGDGPLRDSLAADVERRGLRGVRFFGAVSHERLADFYRAADLTVLPSRSEGIPNVLLESLACGTPFVASRVGDIPSLALDPARDLVEPDQPDALAAALVRRLSEPSLEPRVPLFARSSADAAESLTSVLEPLVAARGLGRLASWL